MIFGTSEMRALRNRPLICCGGMPAEKESSWRYFKHQGYPAYTTSVGWYGYSDDEVRKLCRHAMAKGRRHFRLKVGGEAHSASVASHNGRERRRKQTWRWRILCCLTHPST